ncbi:phosphodiester glycosidase family protein [Halobacillus sp. Marseille-Q1614]|uniref:phosphodiester glycosidase family protein n=1 Tax=Halobacillus sp. Marseille-Q1614 TaxID=2709134 RepID=UPI00156ED567|nr:phosphodiester glycosidase family protein [Halobacillus sp. Marseille-Q1614]
MKHLLRVKLIVSLLLFSAIFLAGLTNEDVKAQPSKNEESLSIGKNHLPESRTVTQLTTGVTHTEISRGYKSDKAYYTVDIDFFDERDEAEALSANLKDDGYQTEIHQVKNLHKKSTDVTDKKIGYVVRTGKFKQKQQADDLAAQVKADGYQGASVAYSEYDGTTKTTGPWKLDVIEIDPDQFKGELTNVLANDKIQERETVLSMARRKNAIAGMNGGYFVVGSRDGTPGDPAGAYIVDGHLVSEAIGERTSLLLSENQAEMAEVSTALSLQLEDGTTEVIDGINRKPGLIRSCGGVGDEPANLPKHDVTCTDESEIIQYNHFFGDTTPQGKGYEVVIDESGKVIETYSQLGHQIPEKGNVISATGEQAKWLEEEATIGDTLTINEKVYADGRQIDTPATLDLTSGGPQLLENSTINIQAQEEGFRWSKDFYYHFAQYRHPRSLAGIKENGNILLVTVDGRNPEKSIGLSFYESAEVLRSLGAIEGMNLDGGGSTTMVADNQIVNLPSDPAGERPVSDGIFLLE